MYGRQKVAAVGQLLLILGPIITATANTMNIAIGKQNLLVRNLAKLISFSWSSVLWIGCRPQRTHCACRNRRACPSQRPRKIRWPSCAHYSAFLPFCYLRPAHREVKQLALQRRLRRSVELHRTCSLHFLLPRSTSSYRGVHQTPDYAPDGLDWRHSKYRWYYLLYDGTSMGR
jgi:hypothetical protein